MNNPTREEELSFYFLYLKKYLQDYRFDGGITDNFIRNRAEQAEETYEKARLEGAEVDEAHSMSLAVLLDGFRYSEYELVYDVLEEEFEDDISAEMLPFFTTHLLAQREIDDVFEGYELQEAGFIPSGKYHQLRCELTGAISIYLRENGL